MPTEHGVAPPFYRLNQSLGEEDREKEFKLVRTGPNSKTPFQTIVDFATENLCAFLNSVDGGVVYFGVSDDGHVVGMEVTPKELKNALEALDSCIQQFAPFVKPEWYRIDLIPVLPEENRILSGSSSDAENEDANGGGGGGNENNNLFVLRLSVKPPPESQRQQYFMTHRKHIYIRRDCSNHNLWSRGGEKLCVLPFNLPSDDQWIPRPEELKLENYLRSPSPNSPHFVHLYGMPGAGKTSLACKLAHRLSHGQRNRYGHGVLYFDLAEDKPHFSVVDLMRKIIWSIDPYFQQPENEQQLKMYYQSALSLKKLILIFDNVESMADLAPVLAAVPASCAVVVISNKRHLFGHGLSLELVPFTPAQSDLFLARELPETWSPAQRTQLAELMGHLPGALAAARDVARTRPNLSPESLISLLQSTDILLGSLDSRFAKAVESIYTDLKPEVQLVFRALCMMPSWFDLQLAAAVTNLPVETTELALSELVYRNLVQYSAETNTYTVHCLYRMVGKAWLSTVEIDQVIERFLQYVMRLLKNASAARPRDGQGYFMADQHNVKHALNLITEFGFKEHCVVLMSPTFQEFLRNFVPEQERQAFREKAKRLLAESSPALKALESFKTPPAPAARWWRSLGWFQLS